MKVLAVIPSRYASSRLPGKPLKLIAGKSMVQRVYEQVTKSKVNEVIVATDHNDIFEHVIGFGGKAIMTKEDHQSGTDRIAEVISEATEKFDYVINVQGDEPFLSPEQINLLIPLFDMECELATLAKKIENVDELFDVARPKLIVNKNNEAIYFSRETIPHLRGIDKNEWLNNFDYFKHIGIYGYRTDVLSEISSLPQSNLELAESLEQLRWIENGYKIKVAFTDEESFGIDTEADLQRAIEFATSMNS